MGPEDKVSGKDGVEHYKVERRGVDMAANDDEEDDLIKKF